MITAVYCALHKQPPPRCAKSSVFVLHNIPLFSAVIRKSIYSLWCNLKNCDNILVQTFIV